MNEGIRHRTLTVLVNIFEKLHIQNVYLFSIRTKVEVTEYSFLLEKRLGKSKSIITSHLFPPLLSMDK